ncbi:hypothetical protein ACQKPE_11185 [Pseudomonas sp. NPDC089554]|uniref:hypothetical protein n=1 Tax=Pseudomonas sp. NPDC089554 TaxID=3390653 RepID=UPI003D0460E7
MLTEKEVAQRLALAESKHGLFAFQRDGIALWRLLRAPIGHAMMGLDLAPQGRLGRAALLWRGVRSLFGALRVLLGGRCLYIVKTYSSALRTQRNGRYVDIYFDSLLERINGGAKWSFCNSTTFAPRERQADVPINLDVTFIQIASTLIARVCRLRDRDGQFASLATAVNKAFGEGTLSAAHVQSVYSKFRWQVWFYSLILRRQRPTAVFVADTGDYALMHAAQRIGIRFVELQHGIFSADHPDALPAAALDQTDADILLPDVLAAYGSYWRDYLAGSALARLQRVVPCGCAVVEEYRAIRSAWAAARPESQPLQILLTTQGIAVDALVDFMLQFVALETRPFVLNVKLHPFYDRDEAYRELAIDSRVRILGATDDTPTHLLMARADVHLSISSACHYDALAMGVRTIVLALPGHELMLPIIASGDTWLATSPAALSQGLARLTEEGVSLSVAESFCRAGFVDNLGKAAGILPKPDQSTVRN